MKRKFYAAIAAITLSFAGAMDANADQFETQRCINMGNALDAPNEGDWGHKIEADSFRIVKEAGFDTVRIPVRWSAHAMDRAPYTIDPNFFARVSDVIDQALAQDLKVILNIHHFEEINKEPEKYTDKFLALWGQIAPRYANLPDTVYFEVINEPNDNFKGDIMRAVTAAGFRKIRESNPTRMIIMGGDDWSGIRSIPSIPQIDDPNQVYTFHYYDPFEFTHQKTSWTHLKNSGSKGWGSRDDYKELEAAAQYAKEVQRQTGIPLFLGEIGAYEKAPYEDVVKYTRETRKAFEAAGISWCVWNFTATFPFYDQEKDQWDRNKLDALGLSPSGPARVVKTASDSAGAMTIDDAFNLVRRTIGRDGELVMAPYTDGLTHYGKGKVKQIKDAAAPEGLATEVKLSKAGKNPWDGGLSGAIPTAVKRGDRLVMAYWAKVVKGDGYIAAAGLQENAEPYTALATRPANLAADWAPYYVSAIAERDYGPNEAGYTIQLAGAPQTLRFGPVFILNLGQGVPPLDLP